MTAMNGDVEDVLVNERRYWPVVNGEHQSQDENESVGEQRKC